MTDEQYARAKRIKAELWEVRNMLDAVDERFKYSAIPEELHKRHTAELKTALEDRLKELESEFAAL